MIELCSIGGCAWKKAIQSERCTKRAFMTNNGNPIVKSILLFSTRIHVIGGTSALVGPNTFIFNVT